MSFLRRVIELKCNLLSLDKEQIKNGLLVFKKYYAQSNFMIWRLGRWQNTNSIFFLFVIIDVLIYNLLNSNVLNQDVDDRTRFSSLVQLLVPLNIPFLYSWMTLGHRPKKSLLINMFCPFFKKMSFSEHLLWSTVFQCCSVRKPKVR